MSENERADLQDPGKKPVLPSQKRRLAEIWLSRLETSTDATDDTNTTPGTNAATSAHAPGHFLDGSALATRLVNPPQRPMSPSRSDMLIKNAGDADRWTDFLCMLKPHVHSQGAAAILSGFCEQPNQAVPANKDFSTGFVIKQMLCQGRYAIKAGRYRYEKKQSYPDTFHLRARLRATNNAQELRNAAMAADPEIRAVAAANPYINLSLLWHLAGDPDDSVKMAVISNPYAPVDVLELMAGQTASVCIARAAQERLAHLFGSTIVDIKYATGTL